VVDYQVEETAMAAGFSGARMLSTSKSSDRREWSQGPRMTPPLLLLKLPAEVGLELPLRGSSLVGTRT